jgi:uncharacterized LabA/DUF88 family protein
MYGGSSTPPPTKYLFIDGAYLTHALNRISERYFNRTPPEINYNSLADGARKIFYYDCLPGRREGESDSDFADRTAKRQAFFDLLKNERGWHVQLGTVKGEGNKLRQKQVDTLLSVDMLTHSYRRNASEIALIAGDLDFKPALDALLQDGMYTILYYDRSHVSRELMAAADDRRPLNLQSIRPWLVTGFQDAFQLPQVSSEPGDDPVKGHSIIKRGRLNDSRQMALFKGPNGFTAVFESDSNPGYNYFTRASSLELVERFIEDYFDDFTWDKT